MPYQVQFVGLAWFNEDPPGTMRVLLPDGRNFPNVPRHDFSICVASDSVVHASGWSRDQVRIDGGLTQFLPPPSQVILEGTEQPGKLAGVEASHQTPRLPIMRSFDHSVPSVNPETAHKVADLEVQQGKFEAYRFPNQDPDEAAIVTTLKVAHEGNILLALNDLPDPLHRSKASAPSLMFVKEPTSRSARTVSAARTIELLPGTEIAIVNASQGLPSRIDGVDHDDIYRQLCDGVPVKLIPAEKSGVSVDELVSDHPVFQIPTPIFSAPSCSNCGVPGKPGG